MKKNLINIIKIVLTFLLFFLGLSFIMEKYTDRVDNQYLSKSKNENLNIVVPSVRGSSMGIDTIYRIPIKNESPKVMFLGDSSSLVGILSSDFEIIKASSGSATLETMEVMMNFLKLKGLELNEKDLLKIDLSHSNFQKKRLNQDVLVSALEYGDNYKVNENLEVEETLFSNLKQFLSLNSRKIAKGIEYVSEYLKHQSYEAMYEVSYHSFRGYEKMLDLSERKTQQLLSLIDNNNQGKVVVELMYQHPDFTSSLSGEKYNQYLTEEIIPELTKKGIEIIDHRFVIDKKHYVDNNHLSFKGRQIYSELVNESLREVMDIE